MRLSRLVLPLALLIPLVLAAPAGAADESVIADETFTFTPRTVSIDVGDTVTWNFADSGHTTTSVRGQAERWDSGSVPAGQAFPHRFTRPGKYQYICIPHATFGMKGVITVGTDTVTDSLDNLKVKRTGNRAKVSFLLNEPAKVTYTLRGPSRRTVKRGRLEAGARSFTVRRLRVGTYRGVLSVVDDFDKKRTARTSFVVR
jgi:plastocyanin